MKIETFYEERIYGNNSNTPLDHVVISDPNRRGDPVKLTFRFSRGAAGRGESWSMGIVTGGSLTMTRAEAEIIQAKLGEFLEDHDSALIEIKMK